MRTVSPLTRLSEHFLLSDFLGCHSVYSKGYANAMPFDRMTGKRMENAEALCEELLEPILQEWGPFTIGYGYISPELSRQIVKYQDPDKPSHHRWDLGAAADVCVHDWVNHDADEASGSPIALAHAIHRSGKPYSRMITYSESPFICLAASAQEIADRDPRWAFYENRYTGKPKVKPDYRQYATIAAKAKAYGELNDAGLKHGWRGAGYPTHHGGGFQQYQHMRVSDYTMVSDWLLDLQSIANGQKNIPSLDRDDVQDAFAAAGLIYDRMIELTGCQRFSIVSGYVSHLSKYFRKETDWRSGRVRFEIIPPSTWLPEEVADACSEMNDQVDFEVDGDRLIVIGETDVQLSQE